MPKTFSISDADGALHHYSVEHLPLTEALDLTAEVWALAVPNVLAAASAALQSEEVRAAVVAAFASKDKPTGDRMRGMMALLSYLGGVDVGPLATETRVALRSAKLAQLAPRILASTTRDGTLLASDLAMERAYAGNPIECLHACVRVCAAQGLFPALGGGAATPSPEAPPIESPQPPSTNTIGSSLPPV